MDGTEDGRRLGGWKEIRRKNMRFIGWIMHWKPFVRERFHAAWSAGLPQLGQKERTNARAKA